MLVEPPNVLLGGNMRHFKKIDWPISLSLLFACVLTAIAACVEPSGPLGEAHVIEGGTTVVASVQITLAQSTLAPGKTTQATVVAKSADGKVVDGHVDFISQNPSIAAVSSNGVVTAVAAGIAVIQATVAGHGATAPVTVQSSISVVAAVAVAFDSTKISVGHVAQASAIVKDTAGNPITGQTITWSSLTPTVATVSSSGTVTAIAAGMASIEATASGVNGSATIAVEAPQGPAPAVVAVTVAFDSTKISVGHTTQASAVVKDAAGNTMGGQTITWSSLTPGIASVSSSGTVTALAAGTASIQATASAISGRASLVVNALQPVAPSVAAVTVTFDSTNITVGHVTQASAVVKDAAGNTIVGQAITWSSLTPAIASVSSSGVVTALAAGTASIRATASGISGNATIIVQAPSGVVPAPSGTGDLAFSDFNDGTQGPFGISSGVKVDFPDDPTGSGHGKVARILYAPTEANRSDDEYVSYLTHDSARIRYGRTIWFKGEVYLPSNPLNDPNWRAGDLRKILDWQGASDDGLTGGGARWILTKGFDNNSDRPCLSITVEGQTTIAGVQQPNTTQYFGQFAQDAFGFDSWHTLEVRMITNSADGVADGSLAFWLDNSSDTPTFVTPSTLNFINESWAPIGRDGQPRVGSYFSALLVGTQLSNAAPLALNQEYRYWDNVAFSTSRIGR